jgi:serine/threonine protein phosphatase PrpC
LLPESHSVPLMNPRLPAQRGEQMVEIAGLSDTGRHRKRNEDAIDWDAGLGLVMVADGMGGNQGGDIASVTALRSIKNDMRRALVDLRRRGERSNVREQRGALVIELVRRANQAVRQSAARDSRLHGMGTTLVMCLLSDTYLTVAHVGDSRLYRLRAGSLERLTEDHSIVQELVGRGEMSAKQAAISRNRNVITRALGINPDVMVDIAHHDLASGDLYMLCSDGLTSMASESEIADTLATNADSLDGSAKSVVDLANFRGGRDNISVVLVRVLEANHGGN